jgi:hypothetical protein
VTGFILLSLLVLVLVLVLGLSIEVASILGLLALFLGAGFMVYWERRK